MAVISNLSITQSASVQINVPDTVVSCQIIDDTVYPQVVLADFTGVNAVHWPSCLSGMTTPQQAQVLNAVQTIILSLKSGVTLA